MKPTTILLIDKSLKVDTFCFEGGDVIITTYPFLPVHRPMNKIDAICFGNIHDFEKVTLRDSITEKEFKKFFTNLIDHGGELFKLYKPSVNNPNKLIHLYEVDVRPVFPSNGSYTCLHTNNYKKGRAQILGEDVIRKCIGHIYSNTVQCSFPEEEVTEPEHYINAQPERLVIPSLAINEGEFLF